MKNVFLVGLLLTTAACSSNDDQITEQPAQDVNFEIVASSGIGIIKATRLVIEPDASTNLEVSMFRIDQYENSSTIEYPTTFNASPSELFDAVLEGNTDATGPADATLKFDPAQNYLSNGWSTAVLALYPRVAAADWDPATRKVTYEIDGKTDIMTTEWAKGNRDNSGAEPIINQPQGMVFKHLLTRMDVYLYAASVEAQGYWGDITGITLVDQPTKAIVTIPALTADALPGTPPALTTDAETGDLYFCDNTVAGDPTTILEDNVPFVPFTPIPPPYAPNMGTCMFAPVADAAGLTLNVITTKESVETITEVTIPSQTYLVGKNYVLVLKLDVAEIIPGAVTITEWDGTTTPIEIVI